MPTKADVDTYLARFVYIHEEDGVCTWQIETDATYLTKRDDAALWSGRLKKFSTPEEAMEAGIKYIRSNRKDLVKDALREAREAERYQQQQKRA